MRARLSVRDGHGVHMRAVLHLLTGVWRCVGCWKVGGGGREGMGMKRRWRMEVERGGWGEVADGVVVVVGRMGKGGGGVVKEALRSERRGGGG